MAVENSNKLKLAKIKNVYQPGLEKYLNSTLPVGQVTFKFCLPGALPPLARVFKLMNPRMEDKLQVYT